MNEFLHTSSSPHVRSPLTTRQVMLNVILALMPCAIHGIWHFGEHAAMILLVSTAAAVLTEFLFNIVTKRKQTVSDYSAVVTGLLLGLILSPTVPLYIPLLGSVFAVLVAKCCFGGLGQNFINPALAGRCFLLISFSSIMSSYASVDAVSTATPLAVLQGGGKVSPLAMFLGETTGTIAISTALIMIGGIYLIVSGTITWQIPVSYIGSFVIMMILFGGKGFDPAFLAAHLAGGGLMIAAFFMATDPVTNPVTPSGHIIFGCFIGILTALFRINGSAAESVSYAVIIGNLIVPIIDRLPIGHPFGIGTGKKPMPFPKAAVVLAVIALIAGACLGVVNYMTADKIAEQQLLANQASYLEVVPEADHFGVEDGISAAAEEASAGYGDGAYGNVKINAAMTGYDANDNVVGYALSVTSSDGYDGDVTLTVGILSDGTVNGISFTELTETAGMGMRVDEADWKAQFAGDKVDSFVLNKNGGSTADNEIDSVSGASTTSGAVVNAVNAAIDFFNNHIKG